MTFPGSNTIVSGMSLPLGVLSITPGERLIARCTCCGNTKLSTVYRNVWPDDSQSTERLCRDCDLTWRGFLQSIGCRLDPPLLHCVL